MQQQQTKTSQIRHYRCTHEFITTETAYTRFAQNQVIQANTRNSETGIIKSQMTKELLEIYGGCRKENKLVSRM